MKRTKQLIISLLALPFFLMGPYANVFAKELAEKAQSPEKTQQTIMVLERSIQARERVQLMDEFRAKDYQPTLLEKLGVISVQLPSSSIGDGLAQTNEHVADVLPNKHNLELQAVRFQESKQKKLASIQSTFDQPASSLWKGLKRINEMARQTVKPEQSGTLGLISSEPVGGSARSLITYALAKLSLSEVPSVFLAGKPLADVNLKSMLEQTTPDYESEDFKKYQTTLKDNENWVEADVAGIGGLAAGLVLSGGGVGTIAAVKSVEGMAGLGLLPFVGGGLIAILAGLGVTTFGIGMLFQDAVSGFGDQGRQPKLDKLGIDRDKLKTQGITVSFIGETRGVLADGYGGRDDQSWWNPADWFDGKTGAYTVVSDVYTRHAYRMIESINTILDRREQQLSKK